MTRQDDLRKLIAQKYRRLQLLKEREARQGVNTDPAVITEIQDIEAELEDLQTELGEALTAPTGLSKKEQQYQIALGSIWVSRSSSIL